MCFHNNLLSEDIVNAIRADALRADATGSLTKTQLEIIYNNKWFKMLIPEAYGGTQLSLPQAVRLEEAISRADGSMGWVVTLCTGAGWFGGFLQPEFAKEIFSSPLACLAGSGAPTGVATVQRDGYVINGKWQHASGAPHATVFTANCTITEDDEPILQQGKPLIKSFALMHNEVTIIPTWCSIGMKATGSHAFEANDLFVGKERTFNIPSSEPADNATGTQSATLYRYPFRQLAEATLAANMSGMAIHFLELCETIFQKKKNYNNVVLLHIPAVAQILERAKEELNNSRNRMYAALDASWEACAAGQAAPDCLQQVSAAAHALWNNARHSTDLLYPFCGLSAANPKTEINLVWRDIHTASQHSLFTTGV